MKLREITPKEYYCTAAACPAIFEHVEKDKLVIVGRKVDNPEKLGIADRIGENEQAVIVDKGMLRQIFEK